MLQVKDRHFLKKKVLIELKEKLINLYPMKDNEIFPKSSKIEMVKTEKDLIIYFINDEAMLIQDRDLLFPTLNAVLDKKFKLFEASVDKGAIKFVANGADVMIPGIVNVDESIEKGNIIAVVDDEFKKTLAIGLALMSANEIKKNKNGKAIKSIHHIGDKIWNTIKNLKS
ncbi:MAG: DUF1947 domain-containing protein [Candidatus Lokiarchaeota archaeon]|nr:DUF1947 domain-containing protein [Candidatus Lokiarchaeota archaeon]